MHKTKKQRLLDDLRSTENPVFTITVVNQNMCHPESISWKRDDNKYKANFIDQAYDDNLVNKSADFIQIVGWETY
jgi:hypothetical protein